MPEAARYRWRRVGVLALTGLAVEAALFGVARLAPAMAGLMRPVYAAVAGVLAYALWHAAHARRGGDRRRRDRRQTSPSDRGPDVPS